MCGLYSFRKSPEETRSLFRFVETPEFPPRLHVAPGGPIPIIRMEQGERHFALVRWGFIPSWTKEVSPRLIMNARGETAAEKPAFRNAMRRRRCLVPADGFYEWHGDVPGRKQAYYIHRPDHGLLAYGGLWEHWLGADGSEIETAVVLTIDANETLRPLHPRMPVIIEEADFETWLNGELEDAVKLIRPAREDLLVFEPVTMDRKKPEATPKKPEKKPPKPDDDPGQMSLF